MRNFFYCLIFSALLYLAFTGHSRAALTGTVTLTGAVPSTCNILVVPTGGGTAIVDLSLGATNLAVANVTETCNDPLGYTVSVAGTNSGNYTGLFVDTVSTASQPFSISYNGTNVASSGIVTNTSAPGIALIRPVTITYAANAALTATTGFTYRETLTFTIAAK